MYQFSCNTWLNPWLSKAERFFAVFVFFYYTSSLYGLLTGSQFIPQREDASFSLTDVNDSTPILSLIQWGIYGIVLVLAGLRGPQFLSVLTKRKCIWLIIGLALVSISWSVVPDATFRRWIALFMATLVPMYFAMRFSLKEIMMLMGWAFVLMLVLTLLFTAAFPQQAIDSAVHVGAWRGTHPHKNALASLTALSAMTFSLLLLGRFPYRYVWLGGAMVSIALVILTTSKSSLILLLVMAISLFCFRGLRWQHTLALPIYYLIFLAIGAILVGFVANQELILPAIGRDATLTGRTEIWEVAIRKILLRPLTGYGYASFWLGAQGESADIFYQMNWTSPNGHNGFLDVGLEIGLLGLAAFLGSLLKNLMRSITWLRLNPDPVGMYPLMFWSYLVLTNTTESSLLITPTTIYWFSYVLITTSMLIQPVAIVQHRPLQANLDQPLLTDMGDGSTILPNR